MACRHYQEGFGNLPFGMAMTWDAILVSAVAAELRARLSGARLRAHRFRWEERELGLLFQEGLLTWHLHPTKGWVTFAPLEADAQETRPLSAHVTDVLAPPDERLLEIHLRRGRGRSRVFRLVVELMTNQWNALLLEGEEGIIRHLLWTRRLEDRVLSIGQPYAPPPPSRRKGIDHPLSPGEWGQLFGSRSREEARRTLLEDVAFISPLNVEAVLGSDPGEPALLRWLRLRNPGAPEPCILEKGSIQFPYPFVLNDFNVIYFNNILDAIQAHAKRGGVQADLREEALGRLDHAIRRCRGRVRGIRKELAQAGDPEEVRHQANLLLARLTQVPAGVREVILEGFDGEEVRISLDPTLSPQENAQALYQEAARRERARERLPGLIRKAEKEAEALELMREEVRQGIVSAQEALKKTPGKRRPSSSFGKSGDRRVPYRRFTSSGGLEIRVGRSSRDNDALTFRHAGPEDIWLHARDRAGAHVVLVWGRKENPPQRDLKEAAVLAVLHSASRTAGTAPVDWTRRKYVRRPKKAPPGTVLPARVQTVFVEPDPELARRLSREKEKGEA